MREYESIYILKPDLPSDVLQTIQDKITEILKKQKGHVLHITDWGKRKLAYRIEKLTHGHYFYCLFLDEGTSISEIERILRNDDRVIKFLTVKLKDKVNAEDRLANPSTPPLPPEELTHSDGYDRYDRGPGRGRSGGDNFPGLEGDDGMGQMNS